MAMAVKRTKSQKSITLFLCFQPYPTIILYLCNLIGPIYRYENKHYFLVSLLICILCCFCIWFMHTVYGNFQTKTAYPTVLSYPFTRIIRGVIWIGSWWSWIFSTAPISMYIILSTWPKAPLSGNLINDIMETERMYYGYRPTMD